MELLYIIFFAMVPILVFFFVVAFIAKVLSRKSRVPFEYAGMVRIPAFSLIQSQKNLTFSMVASAMQTTIFFQLPFSIPTIAVFFGFESKVGHWWAYSSIFFLAAVYHLVKSIREFSKLRNIRLGIEAEWAVSYALSKITDRNVRVFHDIQGPNFNIDHVVTYPGGVLAIETKGRRKPNIKNTKDSHKLIVEGDKIQFPNFTDSSIIEQAKRQAQWLSKELTQSTGMDVNSHPLVVIPGWYIDIRQKPAVPVMNHKSLTKYYSISKRPILDNSALDRINHQIEQLAMRRSDEF